MEIFISYCSVKRIKHGKNVTQAFSNHPRTHSHMRVHSNT